MILGRYQAGGSTHLGARVGVSEVVDLDGILGSWPSPEADPMIALATFGEEALNASRDLVAAAPEEARRNIGDVRMLAPLAPPRMRNFSVYEGHIRNAFEAGIEMRLGSMIGRAVRRSGLVRPPRSWYRKPAYYKGNHLSVIGPEEDIVTPGYTDQLDYELELAVVIGKPGRDIDESEALEHVFGYTLLDDVSARDVLAKELFSAMGPAKGKDFDTGNVLGPWVATRDEVPDPKALQGEVRINGTHRSTCITKDMGHTVAAMVAEASRGETLAVGEVLGTGCCTWGSGMEQLTFLVPGDFVELTLEPFGTQRNRVAGPIAKTGGNDATVSFGSVSVNGSQVAR